MPEFFKELHAKLGHNTWVQSLFATENIVTCEPRNIQAVLATQFNDFEIGEQRAGEFGPLLGHGIFTTDGKAWYDDPQPSQTVSNLA